MSTAVKERRRTGDKHNGGPRGALPDAPQRRAHAVTEIWKVLRGLPLTGLHALLHGLGPLRDGGRRGRSDPPRQASRHRSAAELMDAEGVEGLAVARKTFGGLLGGRDFLEVRLWCSDATEDLGSQPCELFKRTIIAPYGSAEQVIEAADELCDAFDPAGCAAFCMLDAEEAA